MLQEYQVWRNTSSKLRSGKHGPGNGLPFREGRAPVVGMLTSPGWEHVCVPGFPLGQGRLEKFTSPFQNMKYMPNLQHPISPDGTFIGPFNNSARWKEALGCPVGSLLSYGGLAAGPWGNPFTSLCGLFF